MKLIEDTMDISDIPFGEYDEDEAPTVAEITYDNQKLKLLDEFKVNQTKWKNINVPNKEHDLFNALSYGPPTQITKEKSNFKNIVNTTDEKINQYSSLSKKRHESGNSPTRKAISDVSHINLSNHSKSSLVRELRNSNIPMSRNARHDADASPPRRRHDSDGSPPRKIRHDSDGSPPRRTRHDSDGTPPRRTRHDSDGSPPRKMRQKKSEASPPKKQRQESDASPPRSMRPDAGASSFRRKRHDSDASPSRKRNDPDASQLRRMRQDSDGSPPRRVRHDSDTSPPRRKRHNSDASPPRRKIHDSDASPPRRKRHDSDASPPRRKRHDSDASPPRRHDFDTSKKNNEDNKSVSVRPEKKMSTQEFLRARKRGLLKKETPEDLLKQERESVLQKIAEEKYQFWNKGIKQTEQRKEKISSDIHEMGKSFARAADDKDMNDTLMNVMREEDPMLQYIMKKKSKEDNRPAMPVYKGSFPPNRFNIRPGYRWDGVDRSSGYEKEWFARQNAKQAMEEEKYKWSIEDM